MSTPTEINQLRMPEICTYRVREMVASFGRVADYKTTEACDAQTLAQTVVESLFFWFSPYLATVTVSSGDRVTSPSSASKAGRPSSDDVFGEKLKTAAFSCRWVLYYLAGEDDLVKNKEISYQIDFSLTIGQEFLFWFWLQGLLWRGPDFHHGGFGHIY